MSALTPASTSFARLCVAALLTLVAAALTTPAAAQDVISVDSVRNTDGQTVTFEATVSRAFGNFARVQDESGPTGASGITIRQSSGENASDFQAAIEDGSIRPGTVLRVTGSVSYFAGLAQINDGNLESYEIRSQGEPPEPQTITLAELSDASSSDPGGEIYESELVRIEGLEFSASGEFSNQTTYEVTDGDGNTRNIFRVQSGSETELGGVPIPGVPVDFEGVVGQFHGFDFNDEPDTGYQLIPTRVTDLNLPFVQFQRAYEITEEGTETALRIRGVGFADGDQTDVTISLAGGTGDANDLSGFTDPTTVTLTGPNPDPVDVPVTAAADSDDEGAEYVEFQLETDANALASSPARFTLWVKDDPRAQTTLFPGVDGSALLDSLQANYGDPTTLGYDDTARDTLYGRIFNDDGTLETFYSGQNLPLDPNSGDPTSQASGLDVNTEHIYPRSKGSENEPALSNLYILAPVRSDVNSARLNYPYAEIDDAAAQQWFAGGSSQSTAPPPIDRNRWTEVRSSGDGGVFEPREAVKGDAARSVFYFHAIYRDLAESADPDFFPQQDTTMLQWHLADPVSEEEVDRGLRIASYQDNKLNPFLIDPTLANRLYQLGDVAPTPPTTAVTRARRGEVRVTWNTSPEDDVQTYSLYRSTGSFDTPSQDRLLATIDAAAPGSRSETVTYVDQPGAGQANTYRVTATDGGGGESLLSNAVAGTPIALEVTSAASFAFGDVTQTRNYRLVGYPGAASLGLGETVSGEAGEDWNAYWDDGTDENFLIEFDGSDTFTLQPGRGFWLISEEAWSPGGTANTVSLNENGNYVIPLHEGWNIIANPLDVDVPWSLVQAVNDGAVGTLWQWSGGFVPSPSFRSATTGQGYYVFNEGGVEELAIPYPGAEPEGTRPKQQPTPTAITLDAYASWDGTADRHVSTVELGLAGGEEAAAPPMDFQPVGLRVLGTDVRERGEGARKSESGNAYLARAFRSLQSGGTAFDVELKSEGVARVRLEAGGIDAAGDRQVVVVNRATGETHDLRRSSSVTVRTPDATTPLRVLIGSKSYVGRSARDAGPSRVRLLPNRPNPFANQTTISYALPKRMDVELSVYDLLGRRIAVLDDGPKRDGLHTFTWSAGQKASGVYLLRLQAGGTVETRKMVLVR